MTGWIILAGLGAIFAMVLMIGVVLVFVPKGFTIGTPEARHEWLIQALRACINLMDPEDLPEGGEAEFPNHEGLVRLTELMNSYFTVNNVRIKVSPQGVQVLYAEVIARSLPRALNMALGAPVFGRRSRPTIPAAPYMGGTKEDVEEAE